MSAVAVGPAARPGPVHVLARVKSENQKALVEVLVEVTERNFYNFECRMTDLF